MKKIILFFSIAILVSSIDLYAKSLTDDRNQLTNSLGEKVSMNEIIDKDNEIIVIFWDSNNRNHINIIEEYHEGGDQYTNLGNKKIIAICSDKHHNYQQLNAFAAGKGWNIDIFVDVNNAYKRNKGLSDRIFYTFNLNNKNSESKVSF